MKKHVVKTDDDRTEDLCQDPKLSLSPWKVVCVKVAFLSLHAFPETFVSHAILFTTE